jgi:hypothetical protein
MALGQGIVYELQKTGQTLGYLTVGKAAQEKNKVWTALGRWQPYLPPVKAAAATPTPPIADERPLLHRAGSTPSPTPQPASTPAVGTSPTPAPVTVAASEPDADRPTLRRRTPGSEAESSTPAAPASASSTPAKPGQPTPAASTSGLLTSPGTQSLVAVSDEQSVDQRSFQFVWKPGEEAPIDAKLRRLALAQLAGHLTESSLTNVVIRSFDLDLSNDAVMVISAEVPPTAAPAATKGGKSAAVAKAPAAPAAAGATRYITLIARVDFESNPQKLAFTVTDSSRLDVAPRLELIDAVDVDGDGIAELLFRQYTFDEKSFVIYQIGRSTVTKLFEGASQPLR